MIHKLQLAMDFMTKQLLSSESVLAEALEDNDWIDAESSDIYFEFDMHSSYSCHVRSRSPELLSSAATHLLKSHLTRFLTPRRPNTEC